jgi:hypothetical protein
MKLKTIISVVAIAASLLTATAADKKDKATTPRAGVGGDIDRRIQTINRLDNNASAKQAGMAAVSHETAVPLPTIEAEAKDHPTLGLGGLFMAHELSVKTKKPVDQLIKTRQGGKMWAEIARDNGVNLSDVDAKLTRIENALRNPGTASTTTTTTTTTTPANDRTAVRERDTTRTALDTRVDSLNMLDDKPGVMRTGLSSLSKETATPLPQIEELQKQHTTAGVGDLFVAQELATKTQKPASEFLSQHTGGKSWSQIISDSNQDRSNIEQKLTRIEQAMKDAPQ